MWWVFSSDLFSLFFYMREGLKAGERPKERVGDALTSRAVPEKFGAQCETKE